MSMDPITEAIAHFVGLFNLQTEAGRLRADYDKIKAAQAAERADETLSNIPRDAKAPHLLDDFNAKVRHQPEADPLSPPTMSHHVELPDIPPPPLEKFSLYRDNAPNSQGAAGGVGGGGNQASLQTIEPPDSLAALIKQSIFLSDDDYLNMTNMEFETLDPELALIALSRLADKAAELDRLNHDADLSSEAGIGDFIKQTRDSLQSIAEYKNEDADIFAKHTHTAGGIAGTFVDGEMTTEAPNLLDYLPTPFKPTEEDETEPEPQSISHGGEDGTTGTPGVETVHNRVSSNVAIAEPLEIDGKIEISGRRQPHGQ